MDNYAINHQMYSKQSVVSESNTVSTFREKEVKKGLQMAA